MSMETSPQNVLDRPRQASRWILAAEVASVFLIFFIQGAWPVPDLNEPHYLGKAIHYWNRQWIPEDFFLDSPDAHDVFYFTFGWLARYLKPAVLAWTGRLLTWAWLAWAWCRLSRTVVHRPGYAVLSAGMLVALIDRSHMAGEWLIGGVEAKGFAWAFVFMGLERLLRGKWNPALGFFGAGTAFHVLVGGWALVAAGLAWLLAGQDRPRLRTLWPGLALGVLLASPGLIPVLRLNWGVDPHIIRQANHIYVEIRLPHHLDFLVFPWEYRLRFLLLVIVTLVLAHSLPRQECLNTLRRYGWATLAIVACGIAISIALIPLPDLRVGLLRYYWFRLADVIVPVAASLFLIRWVADKTSALRIQRGCREHGIEIEVVRMQSNEPVDMALHTGSPTATEPGCQNQSVPSLFECLSPPWLRKDRVQYPFHWVPWAVMALATLGTLLHLAGYALVRVQPIPPRAFTAHKDRWKKPSQHVADYVSWRRMCAWIQTHTSAKARFLTPRQEQSFKWYAHRSEVATWKDIPQDAPGLVQWWERMTSIYGTGSDEPGHRWVDSLTQRPPEELLRLAQTYQAHYLVVESRPRLPFRLVYRNPHWAVYELLPPPRISGEPASL